MFNKTETQACETSLMPLAMNQFPNDHIIDLLLYIATKHSI